MFDIFTPTLRKNIHTFSGVLSDLGSNWPVRIQLCICGTIARTLPNDIDAQGIHELLVQARRVPTRIARGSVPRRRFEIWEDKNGE